MDAKEVPLLNFLQTPHQLKVPIYQRRYSWKIKQFRQLWRDIIRLAKDQTIPSHFLGSIVYIQEGIFQMANIPKLTLIDGQQRMTTITLVLFAIGKVLEETNAAVNGQLSLNMINNYYIFNNLEREELYYRLHLNEKDQLIFEKVLNERDREVQDNNQIYRAFDFFLERLRKSTIGLDKIFNAIKRIVIVDISLNKEKDNPQLIFESLNSTGLDLSQGDLIRNFVLMNLNEEETRIIYNNYWHPMEESFDLSENSYKFDRFIRDYLTIKTKKIPNLKEIYLRFKEYVLKNPNISIREIIKDLHKYSKYFIKITFCKETEPKVLEVLEDLRELKVDVANPFLLSVYNDFAEAIINLDSFIEILTLVESYVYRRAVCGIATNSLNKTFASLYNEIDRNNYLESLKGIYLSKTSYRRFPRNEEFNDGFMRRDFYNIRNRTFLLEKLENFERKEKINAENYTIEHIMPQNKNLPQIWRDELGENWKEIHKEFLHRIGNLTLTQYNSELSDKSFIEKRDMEGGFRDSPLRINRNLSTLENWNATEIIRRTTELYEKAKLIWPIPEFQEELIDELEELEEDEDRSQPSLDEFFDL